MLAPIALTLVTGALAAGFVTPALAISVYPWLCDDWDFHEQIYDRDEVMCITGDWDIYDFPCCIGDVYLYPNDGTTWANSTIRINIGRAAGRRTIQGCAGACAFYGANLKNPPLPLGEFDIILDEDQDTTYDGGIDYVWADGPAYAVKVIDDGIDQIVDVAGIKAKAQESVNWYRGTSASYRFTFAGIWLGRTAPQVAKFATSYGANWGWAYGIGNVASKLIGIPMSYDGAVLQIGGKLIDRICTNTASVYQAIADDPPDPNYQTFALLDSIAYEKECSSDTLANMTIRVSNNVAEQRALGDAFRVSYERFLGAEANYDYKYARLQTQYAREYCELLLSVLESALVHLDGLQAAIAATNRGDSVFSADSALAIRERVALQGFTEDEVNGMLAVGMMPSEIDSAESMIAAMETAGLQDHSYNALIDSLRLNALSAITEYAGVAADLDSVLALLQYAWTGYPVAAISCVDTIPEGTLFEIHGLASTHPNNDSLSYEWDLDADGQFDDSALESLQFVFNGQGEYIVGLRVEDLSGNFDVAYRRIFIGDVNRIPFFTTTSPDNPYIVMTESSLGFSVTAGDPDGDPLVFTWLVDGEQSGEGPIFQFQPPDTGLYHVMAKVTDGSALSPDNYHTWRVRVVASTGVGDEVPRGAVTELELEQNFPNPFNPVTVIRFSLPEPAQVSLSIYDLQGRLVRVLLKPGRTEAGVHSTAWDGTNDSGKQVPSGIYFCRLTAGNYKQTKKILALY